MPETRSPDHSASARRVEPRDVRILVIDDDPQAATLIELALSEARFRCVLDVATTAAGGLRRIQENAHDIYLVDYRLPDRTGLELIADAKAQGADKPFILMTGYGSGAVDDAALSTGVADYVEKHLMGAYLERAIRYALRDWQTERALREREEQLRRAQKMEAIGRLAGGVAHDFNNLLTAIVGYTDLALERLDPDDATAHDVVEIRNAADRAAALTRQLLAFSRKQFLQPVLLDLSDTVSGMLQMLPRVIGDHIKVIGRFDHSVRSITADPGQIEQVVLNLVLNARDAMPRGGTLTISAENAAITPERAEAEGLMLQPGDYVLLSVTDTGTGMDAATRSRAFEPFFTTKPKGQGTGLGLASVYGIVDQSGGAIALDTAPGQGTTVRIYFPAVHGGGGKAEASARTGESTRGSETILLVEDNDAVRELAKRTLGPRGYTLIEAKNGEEALELVARGHVPHLLLTDVVMPGLSGPNLAARVLHQHPHLRVLYMSGYSGEDADVNDPWVAVPLLRKPFTPAQLAERVRGVLDAPDRES